MQIVFGLLPFITLICLILFIYGGMEQKKAPTLSDADKIKPTFADALVYAVVCWGSFIVVFTEGLGLFKGISFISFLIGWGVSFIFLIIFGFKSGQLQAGWAAVVKNLQIIQFSNLEIILVGLLIIWVLTLLVIAWISPPNTNDSLGYHMPRVAHWAQNGSLAHYPTAYEFQLYNAIWAELVILQSYLLAASDKLANLVQWFSMIGCIYLSIVIAGRLGVKHSWQILAGIVVITIPMGILQSTSTQNDLVTSFWLIVLLYLTVRFKEKKVNYANAPLIGAAIGLGMLTKGTYYPFALPFLLWLFVPLLKEIGVKKTIRVSILVALVSLALNIPYWVRNFTTYNSIIGPAWWVDEKSMGSITPQAVIVNTTRQLSVNFGTPITSLNSRISDGVIGLCELLMQVDCVNLNDSEQYRYRVPLISNHEDTAGNLLHTLMVLLVLFLVVIFHKKFGKRILVFAIALGSAYLVFSATILWELFGSRYQLPFFVLAGPLCGIVLSVFLKPKYIFLLALGLLAAGSPWLVFNRTRPLVGLTPRITMVGSIFSMNRTDLLLANQDWIREPIITIANQYKSIDCNQIGLRIDSRDPEYIFWYLLNAQSRGLRLENILYDPRLFRYVDNKFIPCAIVCSICGGKAELEGLPLLLRAQGLDLYLSSEYKLP